MSTTQPSDHPLRFTPDLDNGPSSSRKPVNELGRTTWPVRAKNRALAGIRMPGTSAMIEISDTEWTLVEDLFARPGVRASHPLPATRRGGCDPVPRLDWLPVVDTSSEPDLSAVAGRDAGSRASLG